MRGAIWSCPDHGDLYRQPDATPGSAITATGMEVLREDVRQPTAGDEIKCPLCGAQITHRFEKEPTHA